MRVGGRGAMVLAVLALVACGEAPDAPSENGVAMPSQWGESASFHAARREAGEVIVSGRAEPGVRIILTSPQGAAFASTAGAGGVLELRLPEPDEPGLYRTEVHTSPTTVLAGEWLMLSRGVSVVLQPGGAARQLERPVLIGAVDYDGSDVLASGAGRPGELLRVEMDDREPMTVRVGADGRYVARLTGAPPGPRRIRVAGEGREAVADITLGGARGAELAVRQDGRWARIDWPLPGGGGQSTWAPSRTD